MPSTFLAAPMLALAGVLSLASAATAATPTTAPGPATPPPAAPVVAPPVLPRLFLAAGYHEPTIPASSCKVVSPTQAQCALPPMTAGRYLAEVTASSTATAADAEQEVAVVAGDQVCKLAYRGDATTPWAVGAKHTFHVGCVFDVISDAPVNITVVYVDAKATKDPAGPTLILSPQGWSGVLNALGVAFPK